MSTDHFHPYTREDLAALADQVSAMHGALDDTGASEGPQASNASRAYLKGVVDALRVAAAGESAQ